MVLDTSRHDAVQIWTVCDREIDAPHLLRRYDEVMSGDEHERANRFHFPEHRHQFRVSRALLREALSIHRPDVDPRVWRFERGEFGRPRISAPTGHADLNFNLSHASGMIVLAIGRAGEIGVDVECLDRRGADEKLARRFFSDAELKYLHAHPQAYMDRFLEIWTLKEAYCKARGQGVRALGAIGYSFRDDGMMSVAFERDTEMGAAQWHLRQFRIGSSHIAALALRGAEPAAIRVLRHAPFSGQPREIEAQLLRRTA